MATTTTGTTKTQPPIHRTEHPHVVWSEGTLGGEPRVEDSRIPVRQILNMYEAGYTAQQITDDFPPLTLAQVHDALSYAYDHPDEMTFHEERHKLRTIMREQDVVFVGGRLIDRARLRPEDVPPGVTVYTWETLPPELDE